MSGSSMTVVYLILGLGFVGGLYYALTQITARQRRLNAELTRLERLAAEVAMNAEAILERVDERIERLNEIAEAAEITVTSARAAVEVHVQAPPVAPVAAPAPAQASVPAPAPAPGAEEAQPARKKSRPRKAPAVQAKPKAPPEPVAQAPAAPQPESEPSGPVEAKPEGIKSLSKYQELRTSVFALADQGKEIGEIAQALGVPRGEVQLILNLRGRKVTA